MLDDLRKSADDYEDDFSGDDDEGLTRAESSERFLGMTAAERMILSIMFFLVVAVLGFVILLASGRINL
ncbi:MAG: hypothetical protein MUF87_20230 [Anaerolineae bacterium]|jgi:1,4-dihydroxy-2-naphthoate octaprenyltransferase|nr:hypothetical protein [Anaerolineae bacterium]